MEVRVLVLLFALLAFIGTVQCGFFYNARLPKPAEIKSRGLKCMPGRTVIKISRASNVTQFAEDDYEEIVSRRTHMNSGAKDETCQICVCSVEGKDEYCSKRPAKNVNECIRLAVIRDNAEKGLPYAHDRTLAYRIRRDYIWHRDEIPYEAKSKCLRGTSYYSNSLNANDTDIDVASEIDSLLDYDNIDICFFCVCSVDAKAAGCIKRDPWFCEYYRILKEPNAMRNKYAKMFQQDRPAYFRQLSYRMRRTMDESVFDLLEKGGDTLCCNHPNGHRRNLHAEVRNKIRQMKRKVPKENILAASPLGDYVDFIVNND
ncbi:unnamed protein product [Leptosia nina]|uniref:Uncharacterized protein n=1 Tax=Leptosia nina TaxID=320188 RepID=A0AAV1J6U8_9NEOP